MTPPVSIGTFTMMFYTLLCYIFRIHAATTYVLCKTYVKIWVMKGLQSTYTCTYICTGNRKRNIYNRKYVTSYNNKYTHLLYAMLHMLSALLFVMQPSHCCRSLAVLGCMLYVLFQWVHEEERGCVLDSRACQQDFLQLWLTLRKERGWEGRR